MTPMGSKTIRRVGGLSFVLALHAGLLMVLIGATAPRPAIVAPKLLMASILADTPPTPQPPIVPRKAEPVKRAPVPQPVTPVVPAAAPAAAEPVAVAAPVVARAEPVHRPATVDAAHSCRQPAYPALSRRIGETGTVVLKFLVDEQGAVLGAEVESSSGYPRLDAAAKDALSLCRFTPGTVDGVPERAWARLRYVWRLT